MSSSEGGYTFTATTEPIPTYSERGIGNFADVDMGAFAVTDGELFSKDYVDCTALAAIGKDMSLLGHFVGIDKPKVGDNLKFLAAVANLHLIEAQFIVIAGANESASITSREGARRDRAFAEAAITKYVEQSKHQPELVTYWNPGHHYLIDMHVNHPAKQVLCREANG